MIRFLAIAVVAVSLSVTAHAQTQTHQLRDVSSGHCMTSSMTLQSCDGTPAQRWEYEAQTVPAPLSVGLFSSTAAPAHVTENDPNAVVAGDEVQHQRQRNDQRRAVLQGAAKHRDAYR